MITNAQYDALVQSIYDKLIMLPDETGEERGLGEMGDTRDEARTIVQDWVEAQNIDVVEEISETGASEDWAEAHFEIVSYLIKTDENDDIISKTAYSRFIEEGHGGLWELAYEWTTEFMAQHKDTEWGKSDDWTETMEAFFIGKEKAEEKIVLTTSEKHEILLILNDLFEGEGAEHLEDIVYLTEIANEGEGTQDANYMVNEPAVFVCDTLVTDYNWDIEKSIALNESLIQKNILKYSHSEQVKEHYEFMREIAKGIEKE